MTARRALGALAVAALVLSGCGLPQDEEPQAIDPDAFPGLQDPDITVADTSGTRSEATLYLVSSTEAGVVVALDRSIEGRASDPATVLRELLRGPIRNERDLGITTAIPDAAQLIDLSLDADRDLLTVNLTEPFFDIQNPDSTTAFSQVVFTVTEIDDVDRVRFLRDGEAITAQTVAGSQDVVTPTDYEPPLESDQAGG